MSDYYPEATEALPLFRRTDPATSRRAAEHAVEFRGDHERRILAALAAGPGTKDELAARCGLTEQQVARRRAGLLRSGLVALTGETKKTPSGCSAEVWRLK